MGIRSQYGHDRVTDAVAKVCAAARKHGKIAGIGGIKEPDDWARYTRLGMRLLLSENDLSMLLYRLNDRSKFFTGLPRT
jgi:2-keto-3-deoxy-L-rhamnonate aldolase RhmA